jgi:CHAT domain-containing protein
MFSNGRLVALALILQAIAPASQAALVTAASSCGAAWLADPAQAVRWARVDPSGAVLTAGAEIVAWLDLSDTRIEARSREHPRVALPDARVVQDPDPAVLQVDALIRIDSSCVLQIHGPVRLVSDPQLGDQAAARSLLGSARDANERGDSQSASRLAVHASSLLSGVSVSRLPQKLDFAAFAVETLLQAGQVDEASKALLASDPEALDLPQNHPSRLRLELARARALSYSDRNEPALALRLALQPRVLEVFGASSDESLWNRLRIANLRLELADYSQARAELESLRDATDRDRGAGDALRISTIRGLANALACLDLEPESVQLLDRLRQDLVAAHGADDARVIDIEDQIARMRVRLDQLEAALQDASKVYLWRTEHLGFSSPRTLQSSWLLALIYKEFGRYDTARALLKAVLEESSRVGTTVPRELTLKTLAVLGSVEGAQGNVDGAEQILRAVWQQYAQVAGDSSPDTTRALIVYALVLAQNDRLDRVCPDLRQAFDGDRLAARPDVQLKALAKMLLGLCSLADAASPATVKEGLARVRTAWTDLKDREGPGGYAAMVALSTLAWAQDRYGDRSVAKQLLKELVELAEQARRATPARSYTRDVWFSKWMTDQSHNLGYRALALLHAQDGEVDEAIRVSELARDRRLRDRFFERDGRSANLSAPVRERVRSLTSSIQAFDERLVLDADIVDRVRLESERTLVIAERDDLEAGVVGRPEPASAQAPSTADLRALSNAQTAIVSIQRSADRWWAIVIAGNSPVRVVMFDPDADISTLVRAWVAVLDGAPVRAWPASAKRLIVSYSRPQSAVGRYLSGQQLAERAGAAILAPLLAAAPAARRLVIVADDDLNGVPFAAMRLDGAAAVDTLEISYAPSLGTYAALCRTAHRRVWRRDLLALAADGATDPVSVAADRIGERTDGDSTRAVLDYVGTHPLPFALKEAEAASANFSPARSAVLRGSGASKAALLQASRSGDLLEYRYIHIAAHAFAFPNDPERSMLVLNAPQASGAAGRVLTAAELANLRMGSELLVLAACGTGTGRYEPGQGLLGFAFAALAAGNRAAVLSLWEVADDLAQRFISRFFERLRRGAPPSAALIATQREFAHDPDPRISSPATWAAFVLYGYSGFHP